MVKEPYEAGKIPDHWQNAQKRIVTGKIVAISGLRLRERGAQLMLPRTRAFLRNDIVELTTTDEQQSGPGKDVNSILYIGFFEVETGGIVAVGDSVTVGENPLGKVAGFSDIHSPNHLNIIVICSRLFAREFMSMSADKSIIKLGIEVEDKVVFGQKL